MLIAVGSVKGSPGATTFALGLAARWPSAGVVVLEADPAGGDLAARFGRYREPGLSALATSARRGACDGIGVFSQQLPIGVDVVFGPAGEEAAPSVALLAEHGLGVLREATRGWVLIVDAGRLDRGSPALPFVAAADNVLVLTRRRLDAVDALYSRRSSLLESVAEPDRLQLVPVGDGPFPAAEISRAVGLQTLVAVPADDRGAGVLGGRLRAGRGWTRLPLMRAARAAARLLHDHTPVAGEPRPTPAPDVPVEGSTVWPRHGVVAKVRS